MDLEVPPPVVRVDSHNGPGAWAVPALLTSSVIGPSSASTSSATR